MSENDRTPSSSSYEKLSDQFDGKMLDFSLKILAFLAVLLLRPLANATAPLFRKNMGIRYFTAVQLLFGLMVWGYVTKNTDSLASPVIQHCYAKNWYRTGQFLERHKIPAKVVDVVGLAYAVLAALNIRVAFQREKKGQYWHSMSRGESWFNNDNFFLEWGISAAVCALLFGLSMPAGALFFVSRAIGLFMHLKEQRMALMQYYDRVDAQIEAKFLNLEISKPKPIGETMGFRLMLPPHIKGEQRANVARVLGGQMPKLD